MISDLCGPEVQFQSQEPGANESPDQRSGRAQAERRERRRRDSLDRRRRLRVPSRRDPHLGATRPAVPRFVFRRPARPWCPPRQRCRAKGRAGAVQRIFMLNITSFFFLSQLSKMKFERAKKKKVS